MKGNEVASYKCSLCSTLLAAVYGIKSAIVAWTNTRSEGCCVACKPPMYAELYFSVVPTRFVSLMIRSCLRRADTAFDMSYMDADLFPICSEMPNVFGKMRLYLLSAFFARCHVIFFAFCGLHCWQKIFVHKYAHLLFFFVHWNSTSGTILHPTNGDYILHMAMLPMLHPTYGNSIRAKYITVHTNGVEQEIIK